jgi:predicted secreted protein
VGGESGTLTVAAVRLAAFSLLPLSVVAAACRREAPRANAGTSASSVAPSVDKRVRVFSRSDTRIDVGVGDTFAIELEANVTTGYEWMLEDSLPPTILRVMRQEYIPPTAQPPRVGEGGRARLTLRATGAGATDVTLAYAPPWDRKAVADTARFRVTIR